MSDLPPHQHFVPNFPRFGVPLAPDAVARPISGVLRVRGAVERELEVPLSGFRELPRRDMIADFHCVTGWSASGLRWSGVSFRTFYDEVIVREAKPRDAVSHILLRGHDGFRAMVALDDALEDDVLLADQLNGAPLDHDHGAPLRFVSPKQYGYKNAKHLCAIELRTNDVDEGYSDPVRRFVERVLGPHPRARVWHEERHRALPNWMLRSIYRSLIGPTVRFWERRTAFGRARL